MPWFNRLSRWLDGYRESLLRSQMVLPDKQGVNGPESRIVLLKVLNGEGEECVALGGNQPIDEVF